MQKDKEASQYLSSQILMIRPFKFRSNQATIQNNHYQQPINQSSEQISQKAHRQFDQLVRLLEQQGIKTVVVQDTGQNDTPDSVFPNNWISFHDNHDCIVYPMWAPNRRTQRKIDIWSQLQKHNIHSKIVQDYTSSQNNNIFLQGTGSLVLDRQNKIAFAAISPRTSQELVLKWCKDNKYTPCVFKAYQTVKERQLIYHTNVMMWIGQGVSAVCLECIDDLNQRAKVKKYFQNSSRQIVYLTESQVSQFAGNCMMLKGHTPILVMSTRALAAYTTDQIQIIQKHANIVSCDLNTIQSCGGGSARCMIAQIF